MGVMTEQNLQIDLLHSQQVSAWIEVLRSPTQEQRASFVRWLKESPRNVREFLVMYAIEQAMGALDPERTRDVQALIAGLSDQPVQLRVTVPVAASQRSPRRHRMVAMALVASLAVVAVLVGFYRFRESSDWRQYATEVGEQRAFELGDGSIIHLNTHSRVAIRLSPGLREVRLLQGEALFRVSHDAARPFRVYTDDAMIEDVGTQFDVYDRKDGTIVSVIEGSVNVTASRAAAATGDTPVAPESRQRLKIEHAISATFVTHSLGASEEAQIDASGSVHVEAVSSVSDAVAWRERRLVFHDRRLDFIAAEFNRYSRRQIHLEGDDIARRVYSGVFDVDDMESLAQVLARDPELSVDESDQAILVRSH
jgi:transmembrane sensor